MSFYITLIINIFEFNIYITNSDLEICFIDKEFIKDFLGLITVIKYMFYSFFKSILLQIQYYFIMLYTIIVLPNLSFFGTTLKYFFIFRGKMILWLDYINDYLKWFRLHHIRHYYVLHHITPFQWLFTILFLILFGLIWRRRKTYLKRTIFVKLFFFYLVSLYMSDFFYNWWNGSLFGIFLSLIISFLLFFIALN